MANVIFRGGTPSKVSTQSNQAFAISDLLRKQQQEREQIEAIQRTFGRPSIQPGEGFQIPAGGDPTGLGGATAFQPNTAIQDFISTAGGARAVLGSDKLLNELFEQSAPGAVLSQQDLVDIGVSKPREISDVKVQAAEIQKTLKPFIEDIKSIDESLKDLKNKKIALLKDNPKLTDKEASEIIEEDRAILNDQKLLLQQRQKGLDVSTAEGDPETGEVKISLRQPVKEKTRRQVFEENKQKESLQLQAQQGRAAENLLLTKPNLSKAQIKGLTARSDRGKAAQVAFDKLVAAEVKAEAKIFKVVRDELLEIDPATGKAKTLRKVPRGVQTFAVPFTLEDGSPGKAQVLWDPSDPTKMQVLTINGKPATAKTKALVEFMKAIPTGERREAIGLQNMMNELNKAASLFARDFVGPFDAFQGWLSSKTGVGFTASEIQFRSIMLNITEARIRELSGAEIPVDEREALVKLLPEIDSPDEVFIANFNRFHSALQDAIATAQRAREESGFKPILRGQQAETIPENVVPPEILQEMEALSDEELLK